MTERQFRRVLENGAWRKTRTLGDCGLDNILRQAARDVRRREAANRAWAAVAPPDLCDAATVESLCDGRLRLRARDALARQRLLRAAARLLEQLRRKIRDVREIVVLSPGESEAGETE